MLNYRITPETNRHLWHITLTFQHETNTPQAIKLANWVAGSYMIRDFSRHIVRIQATCNGAPVSLTQISKNEWHTPAQSGDYAIEYTVYANDLSVRASLLDNERGFIDGACLFLYLPNRQNETHSVEFFRLPENWQIATMQPEIAPNHFQAANYAALTDHPFEMGANLEILSFDACGIPHKIALSGYYRDFDHQRLINDCQKICEHEIQMFQNPAPFSEYLFLLHLGDNIYGGLEHRSSTALHADRNALPQKNMGEPNKAYTELLGLISHEYFHAWNVKSIKPSQFQPYNLDSEVYTEQLWAYEGITSYYDDLILLRSQVISPENYLTLLAKLITRVRRTAGRYQQTLAESSFAAWHKYYKQDENSPNAITSYYQQGALTAFCLDATIRNQSQYSLDTIMQKLYQRHRETGKGTDEKQWQALAQEYTQLDLHNFFQAALYSTQELPLERSLKTMGIQLNWQPENRSSLGRAVNSYQPSQPQPEIACRYKQNADHAVISHVFAHGAAEAAALKPQDKIIAVDGFACTDFAAQTQTQIGDTHTVHYFRHGVLHETQITVQAAPYDVAELSVEDWDKFEAWINMSV
ncbi:M61 family metallopeptidase [Kingella negevensis]|uniref:M61 family metallopeptidase n=1 Tax=Kingella negevensis TaxID=1522312 RepID=UPI00050A2178|nr:M61 family metallopeptidase [Kingella negevensis]MDK4687990.1 M61 family metallopeptidase [Kingella negevensis]WII91026.1 M61 family metallopeptidase [Kingella negevensis]